MNHGHGHVFPRADGSAAGCGGPDYCILCAMDDRDQLKELCEELAGALSDAVEVIRTWHNIHGDDITWEIYLGNAPEMQPICAALKKYQDLTHE